MTISSSSASQSVEEASQLPPVPPAPWMQLEPLTELWAAFGREATNPAAVLAVSRAFAALADERVAVHTLNWLAPARPQAGAAADASLFSLLAAHEAIIEALSRAATHWYEAACALLDSADQSQADDHQEQADSPAPDLETLIGYTLSQRVRVWAIAHSLLADQLHLFFPQHEQQAGGNRP